FHPELTGRENIFLNGTILGMTRKEVKAKFDEIVAFSGVEKFIDTPVKHYSSGMYVRLAFAVAAHLEPEILIIDEVLAVGDAEFQKKCLGKMKDVAGEGRTVIFVSHDLAAVKQLCSRAILFSQGSVLLNSSVSDVMNLYNGNTEKLEDFYNECVDSSKDYDVKSVCVRDLQGVSKKIFEINEKVVLDFDFHVGENPGLYSLFVSVKNINGVTIFSIEKKILSINHKLIIDSNFLTRGTYTIDIFIHIPQTYRLCEYVDIIKFQIKDYDSELSIHGNYDYGSVFGNYEWI